MLNEAYERYLTIEAQLEGDTELIMLKRQLEKESSALESILARLPQEDQAVLTEYLGLQAEIAQRIVEIASFLP